MAEVKNIAGMGLEPLEVWFEPVLNMQYSTVEAYRSQLRINSPEMGVLLPAQYLPVAQRTLQASRLSLWNLSRAVKDIYRLSMRKALFEWVSVYVPVRLLLRKEFPEKLEALIAENRIEPRRLCLELPGEVYFEDSDIVKAVFDKLKQIGVKILITDFGNEFCPVMRACDFAADYVLVDPVVTGLACGNDESRNDLAQSIFAVTKALGITAIAAGVDKSNEDIMRRLCNLSVGKLAGKMRKITGIRN